MARTIGILQIDAFADRPFGGNPAGVVLEADHLSDADLRGIAAEMNVAETAFLSQPTQDGADYRLRWLTPAGHEIAFCGHATVAATHALEEAGRVRGGSIVFDTLGGPLPVRVERREGGLTIWLEPRLPVCSPYASPLGELLAALGVTALADWARPTLTTERDLLLPLASLATLRGVSPDMSALARAGRAANLRGLCVVALECVDPGSLTHARFFAPQVGIPEDPVTGSVHSAIPVWLHEAGVLGTAGELAQFIAEQGDSLGRPGRLRVELHLDGRGRPERVRVGGRAVTVLTGTLRLD